MTDTGMALVEAVRARLAVSVAVSAMVPQDGLKGQGVPRLCLHTPDYQLYGQGAFNRIEIALTMDCFARDRLAAFQIGLAAMAAISPRRYRLATPRGAVLALRWRGHHRATEADEDGLWHYHQRFAAAGIAG